MAKPGKKSASRTASKSEMEFPRAMREQDAMLWRMEKEPLFRSTLLAVTLLDRAPERDRFVAKIGRLAQEFPRLRQRILPMPELVSTPLWAYAADFDLGYHLRFVRAPGTGSLRELLDLTASLGRQALDSERPPWEFYLVEELADGRAAVIWKMHHSMTDGVGGVMLMSHSFDHDPDTPAPSPIPESELPEPEKADLLQRSAEAIGRRLGAAPADLWRRASQLLGAARHPLESLQRASGDLASIRRMVEVRPGPLSPIMQVRSTNYRLDHFSVPFETLKDAAHAASGKLSDAFLAGVAGGLRRYHERHDAPVEALNAAIPISLRAMHGDSNVAGNEMTVARIALPIDEPDPVARIQSYHALVAAERDEPSQDYADLVAGLLYRLPLPLALRAYSGTATKNDFIASSVTGLATQLYVAGARVESFLTFGPLSGSAVNVTLFSFLDRANISVNADAAAVPDLDALIDCLKESFDEVLKLA